MTNTRIPIHSTPSHAVIQEFLHFSTRDGQLCCRVEHLPLPKNIAPDQHVRRHLGWADTAPEGALVHSTSWRYDPQTNALVITWAITPDTRRDLRATPLRDTYIAQGADGAHPVPDGLDLQHVINHAARHLCFLLHSDPNVDTALHHQPALHDALMAFAPDVAGNHQ